MSAQPKTYTEEKVADSTPRKKSIDTDRRPVESNKKSFKIPRPLKEDRNEGVGAQPAFQSEEANNEVPGGTEEDKPRAQEHD